MPAGMGEAKGGRQDEEERAARCGIQNGPYAHVSSLPITFLFGTLTYGKGDRHVRCDKAEVCLTLSPNHAMAVTWFQKRLMCVRPMRSD